MERKKHSIDNFELGMMSALSEEKIPYNASKVAKNCYVDIDNAIVKRNSQQLVETIGSNGEKIINHILYTKSDGTKYDVIAVHSGDNSDAVRLFYKSRSSASSFTEITGLDTDFGKNYGANFVSAFDVLWIADGEGHSYTWDGSTLTDITPSGSGLWGADFDDPLYLAEANGAIYLAGFANDPSAIYHSVYWDTNGDYISATNSSAWSADQIVKISDRGETITALAGYRKNLVIFTANNVYLLSGYVSNQNPQLQRIYSDDGCIDQHSIAEVNGRLYWVGSKGVYRFDGGQIQLVSTGIKDYFEWMNFNNLYKYNYTFSEKQEFAEFDNLQNADIDSSEGDIVSALYPLFSYDEPTKLELHRKRQCVAQKINLEKGIKTDHLRLKFKYKAENDNTVYIKLFAYDDSKTDNENLTATALASVSTTFTGDGNFYDKVVDLGSVDLEEGYYYIAFIGESSGNSDDNRIMGSYADWNNADTDMFYSTDSGSSWTEESGRITTYGLDIYLIPEYATIVSDVLTIDNCNNISKISFYLNDDVGLNDSNKYYYRYSTVSEADLLTQSWTSFNNFENLSLSPSATTYFQIKAELYNNYSDGWRDYSFILNKIAISYTISSGIPLTLYGCEYDNKYLVSIPDESTKENTKVFVFNGKAWTYWDLKTYCMWQDGDYLYYGLNTMNKLYRLTWERSVIVDQWDTQTDWQNYSEDSDVDDTTTSGSIQSELQTIDPSDNFDDGTIDSSWVQSGSVDFTESSGTLNSSLLSTNGDDSTIAKYIQEDSDYTVVVKLNTSNMVDATTGIYEYAGLFIVKKDDYDNGSWSNDAKIYVIKDTSTTLQIRGYLSGSLTSTTIPTVSTIWLKIERQSATDTYNLYYSTDGTTYTLVVGSTQTIGDYVMIGMTHFTGPFGSSTVSVAFDDFTMPSVSNYPSTAYRIFPYNANGNVHIYWEGTNSNANNNIKIYYAKRIDSRVGYDEEGSLETKYTWELLGTIDNVDVNGDTTFNTTAYKYIKVEFNNTDLLYTALLDKLYIIQDEDVEMLWETGYMTFDTPDKEKYIRKVFIDRDSDAGLDLYYKTEKMTSFRHISVGSNEKRVSVPAEHGKTIKLRVVSNNALDCKIKHIAIEYKERKVR